MAGFLVAMGVLGDRVGKRRLMVIGAILYAVVSIAAALTTEPSLMIVWRAVLGLGVAGRDGRVIGHQAACLFSVR